MTRERERPAFPTPVSEGMTLRQWYAGQALVGYFANPSTPHRNASGTDTADYLFKIADAMIDRGKKP